jgi:hypothetical protein
MAARTASIIRISDIRCPALRGSPHIRGIGGRSQGGDEHARERIA